MRTFDTTLDQFLHEHGNIDYQKITSSQIYINGYESTYMLNDYINCKSVTLVDKIFDSNDTNIYFDFILSPIDETVMYQIHFNRKLVDNEKLMVILTEIFDKSQSDTALLKNLMKPLFNKP
ncbi:MAG: hypothetical protein Ta2G_03540 [Termitinemataceae bacterium]|nr:MAG: hypothetical protein Ta2G_03540 [Termitinemataceae bacterium]